MNKITIPITCFFVIVSFCLFLFADAPAWAFAVILSISVFGLNVLPAIWTRKDRKAYNKGICPKCGGKLRRYSSWLDEETWLCEHGDYKAKLSWWRPKNK